MICSKITLTLTILNVCSLLSHADEPKEFEADSLHLIEAKPDQGFHHDYLLYIPSSFDIDEDTYLLVEPNNTGKPDDDIEIHRESAEFLASKSSVGHWVARDLGTPVLMPIFPRPMSDWRMYTHALDYETIHTEDPALERIDLQLIAMINDARDRLSDQEFTLRDKVLMTGFSASGTFINRFVMLHPNRVEALAAGGFNAVLMLPTDEIDGYTLDFPIGTNDFNQITGRDFDLDAVNKVAQLYFMGENDTNDAVQFDDAYNPNEREKVFDVLGEQIQPDRWERTQQRCSELGLQAEYRTINGIGHGTDRALIDLIVQFFEDHSAID